MNEARKPTAAPVLWDQRDLAALLALDAPAPRHFRSRQVDANLGGRGRVFGGQLLGQAVMAAGLGIEGRGVTSLQLCFLRGAAVEHPVEFTVTPLQDGKRYSSRHVAGRQGENGVIDARVSLQRPQADEWRHEFPPAPAVPPPEALLSMSELDRAHRSALAQADYVLWERPCLELRMVDPDGFLFRTTEQPRLRWWLRLKHPLGDDPLLHAAALAYVSDWWINSAFVSPHLPQVGARDRLYLASLNHSLWLHRPARADGWLLFDTESPFAGGGRGLTQARIYDRAGRLVASAAQECMAGPRQTPADSPGA